MMLLVPFKETISDLEYAKYPYLEFYVGPTVYSAFNINGLANFLRQKLAKKCRRKKIQLAFM